MLNKLNIEEQELLELLEFEDSKYGKIIYCLAEDDTEVLVLNKKILRDEKIIDEIMNKYGLKLPEEIDEKIF